MKLSLKGVKTGIVLATVLLGACGSMFGDVEPVGADVVINVVQAGNCYEQTHTMDAGKAERQAAFDRCACEAGHCD